MAHPNQAPSPPTPPASGPRTGAPASQARTYLGLHIKFVALTLICSVIPLLIVGWTMNRHYTRFTTQRMVRNFENEVKHHKKVLELFLRQRVSALQLIAQTHDQEEVLKEGALAHLFRLLNQEYWSLTDLGVIDAQGRHLAYVGPYALSDKNYKETFWFKEVMQKKVFISDMFLGFRNEPHFIIAVLREQNNQKWILRATIDTEVFRSQVENVHIGRTGEVFLVDRAGVFQTTPRFSGRIMEKSPVNVEFGFPGTRVRILDPGKNPTGPVGEKTISAQAWLDDPQWMLVVRQDYDEALDAVNHANKATLLLLHLSAAMILIVAVFITQFMISLVKKRDKETDILNRQLTQTGKMAAIGELSAGVAHEINNPLAIILTEVQILLDLAEEGGTGGQGFQDQFPGSMSQMETQIMRCKHITRNLLKFARRTKPARESININSFVMEVVQLMKREAKSGGIQFFTDLDEAMAPVVSDPSQLQQVLLNLLTNAIDAMEGQPFGKIGIVTQSDRSNKGVWITVVDTGKGIDPKDLPHVFDPFFSTKPVGQGTGLGLSICFGAMKQLGGSIDASSEKGKGARFTLFIPDFPPDSPPESAGPGGHESQERSRNHEGSQNTAGG